MNAKKVPWLAAVALMVCASSNVWSQGGNGSAPAPASSATAPGAVATGSASAAKAAGKAAKQANRALSKKVRAALMGSKDINAANISVRANEGAVTLYGTVPDTAQIGKAAALTRGISGVVSVKNLLTLKQEFN